MAYSGSSERTTRRRIRERVLDHLISLEEETASNLELSAHHDDPVNVSDSDADFQYSDSPESTLSDPGDKEVLEGDKEIVHTPICDLADHEVLEGGLEKIFHALEEMKETQRVHGNILQSILRQLNGTNQEVELPEDARLPITTLQEFDAFETYLKDNDFQQKVIIVLADVGGRTLNESVKRAMHYVMTNDVALKFNFTGKDKRSFGETCLWETVYRSIRRNTQLVASDRQQVASALSKWLTGARDRNGRRATRERKDRERRAQKTLSQEDQQLSAE